VFFWEVEAETISEREVEMPTLEHRGPGRGMQQLAEVAAGLAAPYQKLALVEVGHAPALSASADAPPCEELRRR
jgi:hypothetical protein